jgi:hypothetical protein
MFPFYPYSTYNCYSPNVCKCALTAVWTSPFSKGLRNLDIGEFPNMHQNFGGIEVNCSNLSNSVPDPEVDVEVDVDAEEEAESASALSEL